MSKTFNFSVNGRSTNLRLPKTYDLYDGRGVAEPVTEANKIAVLIDKGIKKLFGKTAFWWGDNERADIGQVCGPVDQNTSSCITGKTRIVIKDKTGKIIF